MAKEHHTGDDPIEQLPPIGQFQTQVNDVVAVETIESKDYLERLAFNEEPVTIWIDESPEENAPKSIGPVQVNGIGVEVFIRDQWIPFHYLPVMTQLVIKRKYLEVLLRSKRTRITHVQDDTPANFAEMNRMHRATSATVSISIIHDANPRGNAWRAEMMRRAA